MTRIRTICHNTIFYHSEIHIKLSGEDTLATNGNGQNCVYFIVVPSSQIFKLYFYLHKFLVQQTSLPSLQNPSFYPFYSTFLCPSALFDIFSLSSESSFSLMPPRCWVRHSIIPTHSLSTDQYFPHSQRAHNPIISASLSSTWA